MTARNQDFVVKNGLRVTSNLVVGSYIDLPSSQQSANGAIISGFVGIGTSVPASALDVAGCVIVSGGNISLNNNVENQIDFGTNGVDYPYSSTQGDKIYLYNDGAATPYTIGVDPAPSMYFNVPSGAGYRWYGASSTAATLSDIGELNVITSITSPSISVTSAIGIGTTLPFAWGPQAVGIFGDQLNSGNIYITNTASTTSGIIFPDGTFQDTAAFYTPSYGYQGTLQFAGTANTFSGDSTNLTWDTSNARLYSSNLTVQDGAYVGGNLFVGGSFNVAGTTTFTNVAISSDLIVNSVTSNSFVRSANFIQANQFYANVNVGIGTATISYPLDIYGNIHIGNTATTTSGILFPDGTYQTTAAFYTPSFGPPGTVQFAGAANVFSGDADNLFWDSAANTLQSNAITVTNNLTAGSVNAMGTAQAQDIVSNNTIQSVGTSTFANLYSNGFVQAAGTITAALINSNGTVVGANLYSNGFVQAAGAVIAADIYGNAVVQAAGSVITNALISNVYGLFGQNVTINSSNESISATSGALQVVGGVGIGANLFVDGNTSVFTGRIGIGTSNIRIGDKLTVVGGNVNVATFGSGILFPDGSFQRSSAGTSAAGPNQSVQFNDGGSFAGLNSFIFDKINVRLGIGTSNLTNSLMVYSASPALFNTTNGADQQIQVGNTTADGTVVGFASGATPAYGYLSAAGAATTNIVVTKFGTGVGGITLPQNTLDIGGGTAIGFAYAGVYPAPSSGLIVSGSVGIGTYSPKSQLDVKGWLGVQQGMSVQNSVIADVLYSNTAVQAAGELTVASINSNGLITGANLYSNGFIQGAGLATVNELIVNTATYTDSLNVNQTATVNALVSNTSVTAVDADLSGNVTAAGNVITNALYSNSTIQSAGIATVNALISNNNIYGNSININGAALVGSITSNSTIQGAGALTINTFTSNTRSYVTSGGIEVTGGSKIIGNLTVTGNLSFGGNAFTINTQSLTIVDPVIELGIGTGGTALIIDDGLDRGTLFDYYKDPPFNGETTGFNHAFLGMQNSDGTLIYITNVAPGLINVDFNPESYPGVIYGKMLLGNIFLNNAIPSFDSTTGGIIALGGVGIGGNININGQQSSITGNLIIAGSNASTSSTTGALVVVSGVGVGSDLNVGGAIYAGTSINGGGKGIFNSLYSNTFVQAAGTVTAALVNSNGTIVGANLYSNGFVQAAGTATVNAFYSNSFVQAPDALTVGSINSNGAAVASTLTSNGTIQAAGTATVNALYSNSFVQALATSSFGDVYSNGFIQSAGYAIVNSFYSNTFIQAPGALIVGSVNSNGAMVASTINSNGAVQAAGTGTFIDLYSNGFVQSAGAAIVNSLTSNGVVQGAGTGTFANIYSNGFVQAAGAVIALSLTSNTDIQALGFATVGALTSNSYIQSAGTATVNALISNGAISGSSISLTGAAVVNGLTSNSYVQAVTDGTFGSIYSNGFVQAAGTATVNTLISNVYGLFGQNVTINSTNTSADTTTGALVVAGGIGSAGNINAGGTRNTFAGYVGIGTSSSAGINGNVLTVYGTEMVYGNVVLQDGAGQSGIYFSDGSYLITAGGGGSYSNANVSSYLSGPVQIGNLYVLNTTASTDSVTGALISNGGVGIAGNLNIGSGTTSLFGGNVGIGTTSNIGATANVLSVYGTENLYGNIVISNTAAGGSGIYFPDGTFQSTASTGGGGTGTPGGSNTNVQFNDNGVLGGANGFVFQSGNVRVGIGTSTPAYTLDVWGNIHIGNSATGGSNGIVFADGSIQTSAANATIQTFTYTATAGQTSFSVYPYTPGPQGVNYTQVFVNGVYQRTSTYAWTGTNIILTVGAVQYARVEIRISVPGSSLAYVGTQIAGSNVFNVQTAGVTVWDTGFNYTVGYLDVYVNGIKLTLGSDYTAGTGTSVTFAAAPPVNSIVQMTGWNTNGMQQIQGNNVFNVQTSGVTIWSTGFPYTVGYLDVYVNGVKLANGYDYLATDGYNVQFINAPLINSLVTFEGWTQGSTLGQMATQRKAFYVASSGQTTFASQGPYVPPYVDVYVNGIKLVYLTDYTASDGNTVVLNSGLASGANVEIISSMTFAIGDVIRRTGDIFTGNVGIGTSAASNAFVVVGSSSFYGNVNIFNPGRFAVQDGASFGGNVTIGGRATITGGVTLGGTLIFPDGSIQNTSSINQVQVLNDISTAFDGVKTTFNLAVGSSNINIATPQQLLISVGGMVLAPFITNTDYVDWNEVTTFNRGYKLTNGRTITFANAPRWQQDFSGRILSNTAPVGNTVTYPFKGLNIAMADC